MKTFKFEIVGVFIASIVTMFSITSASAQTSLSDFSVLPETMITPPDQTPNVIFILDNSGSMRLDNTGTHVGASDPSSRSFSVRNVLREVLTDNLDELNIGFMTFGGESELFNNPLVQNLPVSSCGGYPACGTQIDLYTRDLTGKGTLISNLGLLDQTKLNEINGLIATEPALPTLTGTDWFAQFFGYYTQEGVSIDQGVLVSNGGTPLTGAIESAGRYLVTKNLDADELDLLSGESVSYPGFDASIAQECRPDTFVFLVTDGDPTVNTSGNGVASVADEVVVTSAAAAALRAQGIDTFVFGFQVPSAANMNSISMAGSGRNAFVSDDPDVLKQQIQSVIEEIRTTGGSSSGISVVASSAEGAGSVVQAIYNPELKLDTATPDPMNPGEFIQESLFWNATLSSYFIDKFGFLREDDGDAQLEDYDEDQAFRLEFDEITKEVQVKRFTPMGGAVDNSGNPFTLRDDGTFKLSDLNPIWEAGEVLSNYAQIDPATAGNTNPVNVYGERQRPYNAEASIRDGYRHILTRDLNSNALIDFVFEDITPTISTNINAKNFLTLDPDGATLDDKKTVADSIIRFIRGQEGIVGFRSRTSSTGQAYLLGDIVHSTAVQVDLPNGNFDGLGDESYTGFRDYWNQRGRRRVIYTGSNGGMLHAFNSGFWGGDTRVFDKDNPKNTSDTDHELGAELWGFVPGNLLPQLRFLTDPSYDSTFHVSFVDGPVQQFDARIYDHNERGVNENGWATLIVAGMRLGGGEYPNLDVDATSTADAPVTTRSAYIVMDVTDPEVPPKLIAEISDDQLGYTMGQPTVSRENCEVPTGNNAGSAPECEWYLVFGSGPTELATATSNQQAVIYKYRLDNEDNTAGTIIKSTFGEPNSFVGDVVAQDWNNDYSDDAIYFGTVEGVNEINVSGAMYREVDEDGDAIDVELLIDTNTPIPFRPLLRRITGESYVLFGSGRYFSVKDVEANTQKNAFYAVKEPVDIDIDGSRTLNFNEVRLANLADVTGARGRVLRDGSFGTLNIEGQSTVSDLTELISNSRAGWFSELPDRALPIQPSRKVSASPLAFRNLLLFTDFEPAVPDNNLCEGDFGSSFLTVVDIRNGVAVVPNRGGFDGPLGSDSDGDGVSDGNGQNSDPNDRIIDNVLIGAGYANQSYLFVGPSPKTGGTQLILKSPLDTGEIADTPINIPPGLSGRTSWRELEIR